MNVSDIRREIFSYLRKKSNLSCHQCKEPLTENTNQIYHTYIGKNKTKPICRLCFFQQVGYPDLYTILIILLFIIYIILLIYYLR